MKNGVFWDIKPQFVLHRRHITSPLKILFALSESDRNNVSAFDTDNRISFPENCGTTRDVSGMAVQMSPVGTVTRAHWIMSQGSRSRIISAHRLL
jgi:hypothetical protein